MTGCYEKSRKNLALEKGLLVLMALFLFQDAIQNVCGVFKGFDEIATAVLFGIWMGKTAKCRRTEKGTVLICCCAGYLILVGLLGNCYHTRQPAEAVLKDAVLCFKFVILYLSVNELLKATDKAWLRVHAKKMVRYTVRIMVPTALIYFFLFSDWKDGEQFSIPYQQTFFSHPTYYAGFCFALCAIWILCSETLKKEDYKVLIYLSVMMLSTQRAKAFAAAAVLWIFVIITASRIKISIITYLFCGAASLAVALPKIKYYFWTITDSARRMLMLAGIQVAADYFPLGGGFASFGTATSGEYYSPLYGLYRLNLESRTFVCCGCYMLRSEDFFAIYPEGKIPVYNVGQNFQMLLPFLYNHKCPTLKKELYGVAVRKDSHSRRSLTREQTEEKYREYELLVDEIARICRITDRVSLRRIYRWKTGRRFRLALQYEDFPAAFCAWGDLAKTGDRRSFRLAGGGGASEGMAEKNRTCKAFALCPAAMEAERGQKKERTVNLAAQRGRVGMV